MPVDPTDALDIAAQENANILDYLQEHTEGMVRLDDRPQTLEIAHEGDASIPPLVAKVFQDPGVVRLYDQRTGEATYVSRNLAPAQMRKLNDEGKRMFAATKPEGVHPRQGTLKCFLHPDVRPSQFDEWGLPQCQKKNLLNPMQREAHMRNRHKVEWATIERERERTEREEDRKLQRVIALAAIQQNPDLGKEAPELVAEVEAQMQPPEPVLTSAGNRKKK